MTIPYGKQTLDNTDIEAVSNVLKSNYLTTGPKIQEFEEKFAEYVGAKYAVAVSSGTASLHLACLASGLRQNNELITSPITFAASANCALYCNAKPVFVDIKEEDGLIDESLIEFHISSKSKIIIPVHYAGNPCNLKKIKEIADKHNLIIIEDSCHALGSRYEDSKIGDCKYSDMCCFSFHPVKHITTGEGGMVTTNSKELYDKLLKLRTHGIEKKSTKEEPWHQDMVDLGFNYRLTDFQCALGMSQLEKIEKFVSRRREIAKNYIEKFKYNEEIQVLEETKNSKNSYHLFVIKTKNRLKMFNFLKNKDIFCQVHHLPVYLHQYYKELGYKKGTCPKAEKFYDEIISLPIYPLLGKKEQAKVISSIKDFFNKYKNNEI